MGIADLLRRITSGVSRVVGVRPDEVEPPELPGPVEVDALEEQTDPAHAEGHRHLGPPPEDTAPPSAKTKQPRQQPWVRTTHSDSQKRRPRR
jgi:hypothetical protein